MNKRVSLAIIALFVLGVFLTGCAGSADEVILSSYFQMVRWCEREFGIEPTVVSSEKGKNEVTYVMEDTVCNVKRYGWLNILVARREIFGFW